MKIPIKVLILQLTLNANERTVVREAIEFLSSNNLDSTFTKSRPFLLWKEKLSTFDPYSKGVLFHDIIDKNRYDEYYGPVETDKQGGGHARDMVEANVECECNQGDDHCSIRTPKGDYCFYYYRHCNPYSCGGAVAGCGWFWVSSCNGMCVIYYYPKPECWAGEGTP